ncbi:MAG: universal stress protein [Bacteroidales bacterium]|nr:universal stress protein [Bacteroidales bacterium]
MDQNKNSIIVPYDFSEKADISLEHAVQLARTIDNDVYLVSFNDDGGMFSNKLKIQKQEEEIFNEFKKISDNFTKKYNFPVKHLVVTGKIKGIIKNVLEEKKADLLVTGVNYKVQKSCTNAIDFLGYLKEVNVPIIVTKRPPIHSAYREIVVPVEYDKKYKEELKWVIYLAKFFQCNVNFIRPFITDPVKKKYIDNNIFFTKKMLDSNNIVYGIKQASQSVNFKDAIFEFANGIDADLLIIMSHKFKDYICDKSNNVIESERIPVMTINPRADLKNYQGFY